MSDPTQEQVGGDHYLKMKIQPEAFIYANGIGFHEGNVIKYLCRWKDKGGVKDLEKARHYIDLLIAHQFPMLEYDPAYKPEFHDPANAGAPGTGYRFLVKGEMPQVNDEFYMVSERKWVKNYNPTEDERDNWTHRTKRPLPTQ